MAFNRHFQEVASNSNRSNRFEPYGRKNPGRPNTNLQDRLLENLGSRPNVRPNVTQFNARDNRPNPMDAKDRITSTLKSLGIYKGETGDSSFNYRNPNREGNEGQSASLNLPLWDISSLKGKQQKSGRTSTRWNAAEESHSSTQQSSSLSGTDHRNPSVNPGTNHPGHQPQPDHVTGYGHGGNQYQPDFGSHNFDPTHGQNQAGSNYSSQSQQQGFGSSHEIPYNGPAQLPHYGQSREGAPQRPSNEIQGMWDPSQSYAPQSQAHDSLPSGSNIQLWPGHVNQTAQPTFNQSEIQNLGNQQTQLFPITPQSFGNSGPDPTKFQSSGGLFDIAKKATYSKSIRSNLKPLVEVTISNPAALNKNQSQNINKDPPKQTPGKNITSGENVNSGSKRKADIQESPLSKKTSANQKTPEQMALKKWRKERLILPGKGAGKQFKDDAEKTQLLGKIAQGSQGHQMELFRLIGLKENFALKFLIPWKCYICGTTCRFWMDYINHCTGKNHRNTVHSLGTDKGSEARKTLKDTLMNLPLIPDALCKSMVSAEGQEYEEETEKEVPKEKQDGESNIHACKACGKFYLKVDGLIRHKETEEHKERVEFLEERFGESWQQFQWYNQASQSSGRNAEEPVGVAFIVPISGFFCKLCSQFYNSEVKAKDVHCRQKNHIQKVKEWDRTSKGSMATLPVDPVEIAEAVRQNDKASSPSATKESSKHPSRSRSRSKSRQDSRSSSKSKDKSSSRRSTSKTDKKEGEFQTAKHSSNSDFRIPGLDLGMPSNDVVLVSDMSDVSEEEDFLSDRSGKNETSKKTPKEKGKSTIRGKGNKNKDGETGSSLEEGELSVTEVRQLEKDQEKERIVKEWELRERARHWKQVVEREEEERKDQRKKERDHRRPKDYQDSGYKEKEREKQRREKEEQERKEKELKEKMEKEWLEKEKREKEALERERKEKEQLQKEKERLEKEKEQLEKEREEKERQERERLEREKLEQEERERVAKELQEKERLKQEQREKERQEKERLEKVRLAKEAKEKQRLEVEKKEKERKEQERRDKIRLEQEHQIREEKRRLQHAKEQIERTRRLQEQRENEFKQNQMRERALMEKRIWEQQMREKELMEQQLRQQQLIEQQQLELDVEGKRMSAKERREMERKERELEEQHLRERELKEQELQEQQERELRRMQESQQKEQEDRHREMIEREQKETEMREEEQKQIEEQWRILGEREMRAEELHQASLQEQEIRDRQIREQGFIEWQRREDAMRKDRVPEREIMIRREMFDRELQEMAMRDAEIRAQQLGEVLHDPRGEVDLREVIQQQQMRERQERVLQELRGKAHQELERKEMEMRREGFPIAEIEEVIATERQMMEGQILEELRLRGLAGPEFENEERRPRDTEEDLLTSDDKRRNRSHSRDDRERSRERKRDSRTDDYRSRRSRERSEGNERRERRGEFSRHREEEGEGHRLGARERHEVTMAEEERLRRRDQEEPGTSMGDLVVHERGGFRNVQIVDKEARHSPDPADFSRERDRRTSRERQQWEGGDLERGVGGGREMRPRRGRRGRPGNNRGRARGRRGRPR